MNRILIIIYSLLSVCLLIGCEDSRPSYVIDDDGMEELLYDIHRSHFLFKDGEEMRNDGAKQYAMFLQLLKKHNYTEAQWDSSMTYYGRNADELQKIYKRLSARLEREADEIGASTSDGNDSTNIWRAERSMLLTSYEPYTTRQWSMPADTLLKAGEKITLQFSAIFLQATADKHAECILAVRLGNDSVLVTNQVINREGIYNLTLTDSDTLGIREIKGMFMVHNGRVIQSYEPAPKMSEASQILIIKDISMLHEAPRPRPVPAATLSRRDSSAQLPERKIEPIRPSGMLINEPLTR